MVIGVVGSGLLSYAAVSALKPFKSRIESIIVYTDGDRKDLKRFEGTNQINRYHGFTGTSRYWHGVSVLSGSRDYLRYLEDFYDIDKEFDAPCNYLYVPKRLPDLSRKWNELERFFGGKLILRKTHVKKVSKKSIGFQVFDCQGSTFCSKLFLGINVLDIPSIKYDHFPELKFEVLDHIQVRLGLWRKVDLPSDLIKITRRPHGYFSSYLKKEDSMLMWRPYHGNLEDYYNNQINFGLSKWKIILLLIRSLRLSKILEAFFTKFGYFSNSDYYVLYLQKRVKYRDLFNTEMYDMSALDDVISDYGLKKPVLRDGRIILGNHQVGEADTKEGISSFLFGAINHRDWLKGEHHSLKCMYKVQLDVRDSWFN